MMGVSGLARRQQAGLPKELILYCVLCPPSLRYSGHAIDNPKKGNTDYEPRAYAAWRQFGWSGDSVVKVLILLVTPSLLPLESIDSTV